MKYILRILVISLILISCGNHCENEIKGNINYHDNGIVVKKYINKWDHESKEILLYDDVKEKELVFGQLQFQEIWQKLEIGDSLYKPKGSAVYTIVKKNGKTIQIEVECTKESLNLE